MKTNILSKYNIKLRKKSDEIFQSYIQVIAPGKSYSNLHAFIDLWANGRIEGQLSIIDDLNVVLNGGFNDIPYDNKEITLNSGIESYSGLINEDLTFDILYDDGPEDDDYFEQYPLEDIRDMFLAIVAFKTRKWYKWWS